MDPVIKVEIIFTIAFSIRIRCKVWWFVDVSVYDSISA